MSSYHRKKQPEVVRQTLLDCTAKLAIEQGLNGITVQAVAQSAGVTKGGLFHHFPSKTALLEGLCTELIGQLDADIDARMATDSLARGRFTRAYVEAVFHGDEGGFGEPWVVLSVAMIAEPGLRPIWGEWLEGRLERHRETDGSPRLAVVRLAADGAWLSRVSGYAQAPADGASQLMQRLLDMTREDD